MEPLLPEAYYHIYNHANANDQLFVEDENFIFFLKKYEKYIVPVAHTLAYCLMPNHFHFLLQIRNPDEIRARFNESSVRRIRLTDPSIANDEKLLTNYISKQFANLFSAYTQAFNKRYHRKGSLFIKNFKRKRIEKDDYFTNLIQYIHLNPVKDGFVRKPDEWKFSSYNAILSRSTSLVDRKQVLNCFDDIENFRYCHENY